MRDSQELSYGDTPEGAWLRSALAEVVRDYSDFLSLPVTDTGSALQVSVTPESGARCAYFVLERPPDWDHDPTGLMDLVSSIGNHELYEQFHPGVSLSLLARSAEWQLALAVKESPLDSQTQASEHEKRWKDIVTALVERATVSPLPD